MATSVRLAVFNLLLVLLARPAWAEPASNTPAPPAAAFPVDPAPQATPPAAEPPSPAPVPEAPPPPPGAVAPSPFAVAAAPVAPPAPSPVAPPPSPAEVPPDDVPPRREPRYDDYRLQLVASDAIALGLAITGASWDQGPREELGYAAFGVYALGAPMVHAANGHALRGLASAGMRLGFPLGGTVVGVLAALPVCAAVDSNSDWGCLGPMAVFGALGLVAGGLTAVIIDDGFFGKVEIKESASQSALRRGHSVRAALVPILDPHRKTLGASLVGSF